jgi:hypothetical protein
MKQILHIFAKDSRHFWPEILVSLAITAVFTWTTPHGWGQPGGLGAVAGFAVLGGLPFLGGSLALIVVVSWWLLIARVVHDESLVGDRQFWLTRPYEWSKLLAAKAVFLLVYLYVPFFIAKLILLKLAGFHPLSYLPGLLLNLLLVTAALVAPLFAIATVTANFARMALAVIAIIVGFIAALVIASVKGAGASMPAFTIPLIPWLCGAVIVLQYASRRVRLSRLLLIGYPLVSCAISFVVPGEALTESKYPAVTAKEAAPIQLAPLQDQNHLVTVSSLPVEKLVQVGVPLQFSGVATGHMLTSGNIKVSIEAVNGVHWTSPWQYMPLERYVPGSQDSSVYFRIKRTVLESFRSMPVTLHLTLAFTDMRAGFSRRVAVQTSDFPVSEFGICAPEIGWDGSLQITGITCKSALRQPPFNYVEAMWSNGACSAMTTEQKDGVKGDGWIGESDRSPAEFGISPVWVTSIPLSNNMNMHMRSNPGQNPSQQLRYLCPGTPLTFTQYDSVRQIRSELTIRDFHFPQ